MGWTNELPTRVGYYWSSVSGQPHCAVLVQVTVNDNGQWAGYVVWTS